MRNFYLGIDGDISTSDTIEVAKATIVLDCESGRHSEGLRIFVEIGKGRALLSYEAARRLGETLLRLLDEKDDPADYQDFDDEDDD